MNWKIQNNQQIVDDWKIDKNQQNENYLHHDIDENSQNDHDSKSDNLNATNQRYEKSIWVWISKFERIDLDRFFF